LTDRRHTRIPLALEVTYRNAGAFLVAYTTNLSKGGVFIETDEQLPVGSELVLRFGIPGETPVELVAKVARVSAIAEGGQGPGMGLRFEQLDVAHGDFVDRLVGRFSGLKVLLVGDDPAARTQVARLVRSVIATAEVRELSRVEQAEKALQGEVDVLLVDLSPSPRELRRAGESRPSASEHLLLLRLARANQPPIPTIALSQEVERRTLALELGADSALPSPPPLAELQAELLRLLGRPHLATLR
jgi:uncharacterized protein (TIGR02266 family)